MSETKHHHFRHHLKQPRVFPLAVATSLFERFGFYILAMLMVLYTSSQFGMSDKASYILYGVFSALVFITPAAGGWLADNILGIKRTMVIGLVCEAFGLALVSLPNMQLFLVGLSLVIIGVGFFKTGPTNLLGRSYKEGDTRIDTGFTFFYMAMNLGAFFSPIVAGYLQHSYNWEMAFLFGAVVLFGNVLVYYGLRHRADGLGVEAGKKKLTFRRGSLTLIGIIAAIILSIVLLHYPTAAHYFFFVATAALLIYVLYEIGRSVKTERLEILACVSLLLIGMVFFIMYFQYYMSITLFIKRCIQHKVFGVRLPTEVFLSLNAFWIVVLSPLMVWFYTKMRSWRGKDLAVTTKFSLGMLIMAIAFFVLALSTHFYNQQHQTSAIWLAIAILLYSTAELLISALGVAMVTHIAPKRMYGVMMGAWYLIAAAMGSSLASNVATISNIPTTLHDPATILHIYGRAFFEIGIGGLIATVVVFAVAPYIKKIAHL